MKPGDTISVLLCVHSRTEKHDQLLGRALGSLARQTYQPDEVIVVMDECWTHTRQHIDAYKDAFKSLAVFQRPKKQGLAWAKNFGIKRCKGDWIAYLDADDGLMDCKLEVQRAYMMEHPELDFCSTEAWDLDPSTEVLRPNLFAVGQYRTHLEITRRLPYENILCHGSMMIRRDALDSIDGPYRTDSSVYGKEDWDLWMRAAEAGFVFGKVPERLYIWSTGTGVLRGEVV